MHMCACGGGAGKNGSQKRYIWRGKRPASGADAGEAKRKRAGLCGVN